MLRPGSVRKAQAAVIPVIVLCQDHEEEVKHYCENCKCLVCSECVTDRHYGHKFQKTKDIVKDKRQKLSTSLNEIEQEVIPEMREKLTETRKTKSEHSENGTDVVDKINKRADFLISSIDKTRKEFIHGFNTSQSRDQKMINKFEQTLTDILSEAEDLVVSCRDEMKSSKDARIVQLEMDLSEKTLTMKQQIQTQDVPIVQRSVFVPGTTDNESIKRLFGRVLSKDESEAETASDILPSQPNTYEIEANVHVIETKLEVVSSFQHETDKGTIMSIVTQADQSAWIAKFDGTEIKRVNQTGKVDKTLTFTTRIGDLAITGDGSLLVTPNGGSVGHENQIKKVKPNGDIVTFVDIKPLEPSCICLSKTGHIYVGCVDGYNLGVTDNNTRCVKKLSGTGIVQGSYEYDDNGQRLFTLPRKMEENINGDVWVRDKTADCKGRIVVLQQDGKLRFIYTGVKNDKITEDFNPWDLTSIRNGSMLVSDTSNNIIHGIDGQGSILFYVGSQHKTGIYGPRAICLNKKDNALWVGDFRGEIQVLRLL